MKSKLSCKLIKSAISGDVEAITRIVSIYEPYLSVLATKKMYDFSGEEYLGIDVDLRNHLITKLINVIITYKIR